MTLCVGVTFIWAFAIVATLDVNIHKSKQLGAIWVLPRLFLYSFVALFLILYKVMKHMALDVFSSIATPGS